MRKTKTSPIWALAVVAALGMGLAGCGGGSSTPTAMPDPEPDPAAEEMTAINTAIAAAQMAAAAVMDDSDDATVTAADDAIAAAGMAVAGARLVSADVINAANARLATIRSSLGVAKASRQVAMDAAAEERRQAEALAARRAEQMAAISDAIAAAATAVGMVMDDSDADTVAAADMAIEAARTAISDAADLSDDEKATYTASVDTQMASLDTAKASRMAAMDLASQKMAISDAIAAAMTAVAAVMDDSDDSVVSAAEMAVAAARAAIANATDVSAEVKAANTGTVDALASRLTAAKDRRTAAMAAAAEAARIALIDGAKDMLASAEMALAALADDATDEEQLAAQRAVEMAASDLRDVLRANGGSDADIDEATRKITLARIAAEDLQMKITADANALAAMRMANITAAQTTVTTAQAAVDALTDESTDAEKAAAYIALRDAAANLKTVLEANGGTEAQIAAAETTRADAAAAVDPVQERLMAAQNLADQRKAISDAIAAARSAVTGINDESSDEDVDAAEKAIADARVAIAGQADIPDAEKEANRGTVGEIEAQLNAAKTSLMAAREAAAEEQKKADAAMAATAAKLYDGLQMQGDGVNVTGLTDVFATYEGDNIAVTTGDGTAANTVTLMENDDAMVADNYGWEGMMYADPAGGDMYEAVVYSNVEDPTPGRKFGSAALVTDPPTGDYQYKLTNGGLVVSTITDHAARVGLTSVTRTAGTETFNLPDPNPGGADTIIGIAGSYHGVSGTYTCAPIAPADGCSATVAAMGFTLEGGTWTFTPGNAEARVMEVADVIYASYGWWIRKAENDGPFTASAFTALHGAVPAATDITALEGTATYTGGAAGKYAISSTTGGKNDAGHFTAKATLEANFNTDTITGTIDNFMGADDMSRNWSVALNNSTVSDGGAIAGDPDTTDNTNAQMTVWTIDGTAGDAAGEWSGSLLNNGDDGVPQVATGTFYSMFGRSGKMVGAFGANAQ